MLTRLLIASIAFTLVAASPKPVSACMPGALHPRKEAFLFWHDGVEVIVWRSMVQRQPDGRVDRALPLAWVLAVPAAPLAYAIAEQEHFESAQRWANGYVAPIGGGDGYGGSTGRGSGGIEVGETVRIGEYEITPVEGTGEAASAALTRWLRQNSFSPPDASGLSYYTSRGATFLAVKAQLPAGKSAGDLRPLAIAFPSPTIQIPIHLSTGEPPYAMTVTVLSSKKPEIPESLGHGLSALPMSGPGSQPDSFDNAVVIPDVNLAAATRNVIRPILDRLPQLARLQQGALYLARVTANPMTIEPAQADPTIPLGALLAPNATGEPATEPSKAPAAEAPPPAPTPTPAQPRAAAAEQSDDGCAVTAGVGRSSNGLGPGLWLLGAAALVARRSRRGSWRR